MVSQIGMHRAREQPSPRMARPRSPVCARARCMPNHKHSNDDIGQAILDLEEFYCNQVFLSLSS